MYSKQFSFRKTAPITNSYTSRYPNTSQTIQPFRNIHQTQREDCLEYATVPLPDPPQIGFELPDRYSDSSYPLSSSDPQLQTVTYCNPGYFTVQTDNQQYQNSFVTLQEQAVPTVTTQITDLDQGADIFSGVTRQLNEMFCMNNAENTTANERTLTPTTVSGTRSSPKTQTHPRDVRHTPETLTFYSDPVEDPDSAVIAAASAAKGATFNKPSIQAPVKQMKTFHGKRMSQDRRNYIASTGGEEDNEDQAIDETSEQSDTGTEREEEVQSPVSATTNRSPSIKGRSGEHRSRSKSKNTGKRRRSSSRSSFSGSSAERSPKRRDKEHSKDDGHRRKSKKSDRRDETKKSQSKRRRSHSRSRSRAASVLSERTTSQNQRSSTPSGRTPKKSGSTPVTRIAESPATPNTSVGAEIVVTEETPVFVRPTGRAGTPIPPKGQRAQASLQNNASNVEALTNVIFDSIMRGKQSQRRDPDAESRVLSVTSKRSRRLPTAHRRKSLDLQSLEKYLPEELSSTELSKHTVRVIFELYKNSSNTKNGHLVETVMMISHVPIDFPVNNQSQPQNYPQINGKHYLFSTSKQDFGHDYQSIERKRDLLSQSLLTALKPNCNMNKNSLDLTFRRAMKDICEEVHGFEDEGDISLENPIFISGRYLELRLLQKIRDIYTNTVGLDIIKYLTDSFPDEKSPLKQLVEGSTCEMYVRTLLDRYNVRLANFENVLAEVPIIPQNMRVWTNADSQTMTNVQIANHIRAVFGEVNSEFSSLNEEEKAGRSLYHDFITEYSKRMKGFVKTCDRFLSETLRASELLAWFCFGLTTNHHILGPASMATSFLMAKIESDRGRTNPAVCWNYPLASMYRREILTSGSQMVITLNDLISNFENRMEPPEDN